MDISRLLFVLQAHNTHNLQKPNIFKVCQIYYDYAAEMPWISECLLPFQLMECSSSQTFGNSPQILEEPLWFRWGEGRGCQENKWTVWEHIHDKVVIPKFTERGITCY